MLDDKFEEVPSGVPDSLEVVLHNLVPWTGLFAEQCVYNHGVKGARQLSTACPSHEVLNAIDVLIPRDPSHLVRDILSAFGLGDLAGMATPGYVYGEFLIHVLNDGADPLLVSSLRFRVFEKWITICAVDRCLDEGVE